ncbi:unnamed protein product [Ilex paraguariensis]|uniref:Ubiquitin-like domain-containing protein n=1 Tax=Ilex paraguariensis TaxID=185542 RepID=A0ABC8UK08_9AQUA
MRMTLLTDDRVCTNFALMSAADILEFAVMIPSGRILEDEGIERGQLGLNAECSKFFGISAGDEVNIKVFVPPSKGLDLSLLRIEVDLLDGSSTHQPVLASNFVREFVKTFNKQIFTEIQSILLRYGGNIYHCTVADASVAEDKHSPAPKRGMLRKSTEVIVEVSSSMVYSHNLDMSCSVIYVQFT